jgi:hypothetical protein
MHNIYDINKFIDQVRSDGKAFYSEQCVKRIKLLFEKSERYEEYLGLYRLLHEQGNISCSAVN